MLVSIHRMKSWGGVRLAGWLTCVALLLLGSHFVQAAQGGAVVTAADAVAVLSEAQREQIDNLLELINQRLAVAEKVAEAKWNSGAPIDDPARERKILDELALSIREESELDRGFALRFFQAQFDAGKMIQRDLHAQWQRQQRPPFVTAPDLARDVRPVLDRLTPQLIDSLRQLRTLLLQTTARDYLAARAQQLITLDGIDLDGARAEAVRVLLIP